MDHNTLVFSYCKDNQELFEYENNEFSVLFSIVPVNIQVALIRFVNKTDHKVISCPPGFSFQTYPDKIEVVPFNNQYFVTWFDSYEILYEGDVIWSLINQKQQSIHFGDCITKK